MKKCKYCKEIILTDATTCMHCGGHQNRLVSLLNVLSSAGIIISIGLLFISILQFSDSKKERIDSQKALSIANKVKEDAYLLYEKVDSMKKEMDTLNEFINKTTLLAVQNEWIHANTPIMGMNTQRPSVKKFEKNTNELIKLLIPDDNERKNWWDETDRLLKSN